MRRLIFLLVCLVVCGLPSSFAQMRCVQGTVYKSETNNPISQIKVTIKGTDLSATTDEHGTFRIEVPDSIATITFSEFFGMNIKDVFKSDKNNYYIYLDDVHLSDISNLSLEELVKLKVVSASNVSEKLSEVPATMIVISEKDILERGYQSVSEIFADLPGMDIARYYGDMPVFNYWRGFRSAYSQPYVFMVDGMVCNDIFYNQPQIMDNLPMSNIEKIEIVYGPVSAVYGANAFMGVINVITKKEGKENALTIKVRNRISLQGDLMGDMFTHYQKGKFRASLAVRAENTDLARKINLNDNYTNQNLLTDTLLWGSLAKSLNTGGKVSIPYTGKSVDFRFGYNNTEAGIQINTMRNGQGLDTPFDKYMPNVSYPRLFINAWIKQDIQLHEKVNTNITLRYISENREGGDWIEAKNITNNTNHDIVYQTDTLKPGQTKRLIDYSVWPLKNEKISYLQQFNFNITDKLFVSSGLQFDQTYITKQEAVFGRSFTVRTVYENHPDFYPKNAGSVFRPTNRVVWKDYGIYAQVKYTLSDKHIFNLGLRLDDNSEYGFSKTIRAGYKMNYQKFSMKLLYGEAYQIPTPRTLYSLTTILGSSSDLKPETSQTFELNLNYTNKNISSWVSTYKVINKNTIVFIGSKAQNLAQRNVFGLDAYFNAIMPVSFLKRLSVWAYYSTYFIAREDIFDSEGMKTGTADIGDLSTVKLYFGTTAYAAKNVMINFRGRFIGNRKAVSTNITRDGSVRVVDACFTADANILYQNLFTQGISIALKVENIFNTKYYHPGVNKADSGTGTGNWVKGVWQGSEGWNNSLLPQANRYITISMLFNL
jgi:outer membrane receptor for ferrienterochelin and colicins